MKFKDKLRLIQYNIVKDRLVDKLINEKESLRGDPSIKNQWNT